MRAAVRRNLSTSAFVRRFFLFERMRPNPFCKSSSTCNRTSNISLACGRYVELLIAWAQRDRKYFISISDDILWRGIFGYIHQLSCTFLLARISEILFEINKKIRECIFLVKLYRCRTLSKVRHFLRLSRVSSIGYHGVFAYSCESMKVFKRHYTIV